MAITVKHSKVSTIPDGDDSSVVRPSDWNDDHVLTGTIPVANGGTGAATLTGYVKGTGTTAMTASATIPNTDITGLGTASTKDAGAALGVATLDAGGKVPVSELPAAVLGALSYQGTWDASTNTPTLTSSVGSKGYYYVVNVAGNTDLNGITDWLVGDWAVYNGTDWQKVDNTDSVTSVNGLTGAVVLTTTNINEGTNLYYTDVRARASNSAGTGISYDSATGVITNSAPDQTVALTDGTAIDVTGTYPNFTINNTAPDQIVALTGAGTTTISGTYPNFTITSADSKVGDVVGPASATDNAIARYDTTTGKLIQNSVVTVSDTGAIAGATTITDIDYIDFDTTYATTLGAGQLGWNGNDTLGLGMIGGNVVQHIGEDSFFYAKATATITKGQVVMFTGAVGASGVPTGAPATGITDGTYIMGIAAENIANNGFGLVQAFGTLRNVNTSGYADGDILWYNPAVTGGLTKTKPVAPNIKAQMAAVINGGSVGGGTILIRISAGSTLGGTDSNAEITSPTNGQIITYDGLDGYWKNTDLTAGTAISVAESSTGVLTINNTGVTSAVAGTGISVSGATGAVTVTNTAPDQVVALTGAGTTSISGTYPNFTITSNDSTTGTVTSVAATAGTGISVTGSPITTSGTLNITNTAPDQTVVLTAGTGISTSGTYPNFTITNTSPSSGGTVTSVAALTIGTTGTDLSSTVANGTTTPVITLQVPTASAVNRGALSAADWTTFNAKAPAVTYTTNYVPFGQGTTTPNQSVNFTYTTGTGALRSPAVEASNGLVVNNLTIATSYSIPSGYAASSVGPVVLSSGVTITVPSGSRWVVL